MDISTWVRLPNYAFCGEMLKSAGSNPGSTGFGSLASSSTGRRRSLAIQSFNSGKWAAQWQKNVWIRQKGVVDGKKGADSYSKGVQKSWRLWRAVRLFRGSSLALAMEMWDRSVSVDKTQYVFLRLLGMGSSVEPLV